MRNPFIFGEFFLIVAVPMGTWRRFGRVAKVAASPNIFQIRVRKTKIFPSFVQKCFNIDFRFRRIEMMLPPGGSRPRLC